jgi:hypothetical protein
MRVFKHKWLKKRMNTAYTALKTDLKSVCSAHGGYKLRDFLCVFDALGRLDAT